MQGWQFGAPIPQGTGSPFEQLLKIFQELLLFTAGDVGEALSWLNEIDNTYKITTADYGMGDFIQELIDKGYITPPNNGDNGGNQPTRKMEVTLRKKAMDEIFGTLKKASKGDHSTRVSGRGDEATAESRPYEFGDALSQIAVAESMRNAYINNGIDDFRLTTDDLAVHETLYQSQISTVLMIDISHSMILYGEDRITPAKKVAMALAEMIRTQYPKDSLDIVVFGNDAWQVQIADLPYLQVGPYHTNTVAGLELAIDLLRKRRNPNKQIFMITDGKPSCIKQGNNYYKNSFGLDRKIVGRTLTLAQRCKKMNIPITTFMIATDPYLMRFIEEFTATNNGKAFYTALDGLGDFIFRDYKKNKRK